MLDSLGPDIWTCVGPAIDVLGFQYQTRMVVIKLSNGSLFIWSPIGISERLCSEVDSLGRVAHIIAPNSLHHLSIPEWQKAYPEALVHAAPRLREKRTDIVFDHDLNNASNPAWAAEIDQVVIEGNLITTEVVFFHVASGTVLFTDLIHHFPESRFSGWRKLVARLDLMTAPEPAVPRKFRLAFTNRAAARASLRKVLAWPARKVVFAHGAPVKNDAHAFLVRAFRWLNP